MIHLPPNSILGGIHTITNNTDSAYCANRDEIRSLYYASLTSQDAPMVIFDDHLRFTVKLSI